MPHVFQEDEQRFVQVHYMHVPPRLVAAPARLAREQVTAPLQRDSCDTPLYRDTFQEAT